MSEASHIQVKVSMGQNDTKNFSKMVTLERIVEWIKRQELDDYTTNGLIEAASKYPTAALSSFHKNFNIMLQRVRSKRKLEQGESYVEVKATSEIKNPENATTETPYFSFEEAFDKISQVSKEEFGD